MLFRSLLFLQVTGSVTAGSVSVMRATSGTTATAPQRSPPACQKTGRRAAAVATVCADAASAQSPEPLETPARNAPPAPMPVAPRGTVGPLGPDTRPGFYTYAPLSEVFTRTVRVLQSNAIYIHQ